MLQEQLDQLQFDKEESEVKYDEMKVSASPHTVRRQAAKVFTFGADGVC